MFIVDEDGKVKIIHKNQIYLNCKDFILFNKPEVNSSPVQLKRHHAIPVHWHISLTYLFILSLQINANISTFQYKTDMCRQFLLVLMNQQKNVTFTEQQSWFHYFDHNENTRIVNKITNTNTSIPLLCLNNIIFTLFALISKNFSLFRNTKRSILNQYKDCNQSII